MGNSFQISAVSANEAWANKRIDAAIAEIRRIEKLLTTFSDDSETALINNNAGIRPVTVSQETFNIIERSLRISALTQGAFDITYGSVDKRETRASYNTASAGDSSFFGIHRFYKNSTGFEL